MPEWHGIPYPALGFRLAESPMLERVARKAFVDSDTDRDELLDVAELYVAILKLYDALNSKLPCRLRVPDTPEVFETMHRFDADKSGKLSFPEFHDLAKALVGAKGPFYESLLFKGTCVVLLKVLVIPLLAKGLKRGVKALGVSKRLVDPVPVGILALGLETAAKQTLPVPL